MSVQRQDVNFDTESAYTYAGKLVFCAMMAVDGQPKQVAVFSDMSKGPEHLVRSPCTHIVLCQQGVGSNFTLLQIELNLNVELW